MSYLITGACGFLGSNIAARLLQHREKVILFDDLSRVGSQQNLSWLKSLGEVEFVREDIRNHGAIKSAVQRAKPEVVFHLAGQVAMTTSLQNPRDDFEINVTGSLNLLEAIRSYTPRATVIYSSSNKVYGNLDGLKIKEESLRYSLPDFPDGIDETAPLDFQTPYGCSKGAADQYMLDYARTYGLNTVVFRHSTIFGGRQLATFDQGWVGWFCQKAIEAKESIEADSFTISGNGKQVRDLLFIDDAVACYLNAVKHIRRARGQSFNIGGGIENSSSLLELFAFLEKTLAIKLNYHSVPERQGDQKFFVANIEKAKRLLDWHPTIRKEQGIKLTLDYIASSPKDRTEIRG